MSSWVVAVNDPSGRGQYSTTSTVVYCDTELQARVDGAEMLEVPESTVTARRLDDTMGMPDVGAS